MDKAWIFKDISRICTYPHTQTQIHPQIELNNQGKIVAIDLETGDFEVDAREIVACNRRDARRPDAQIWIVRVGSRHVRRFGGRIKRAV